MGAGGGAGGVNAATAGFGAALTTGLPTTNTTGLADAGGGLGAAGLGGAGAGLGATGGAAAALAAFLRFNGSLPTIRPGHVSKCTHRKPVAPRVVSLRASAAQTAR